MASDARSRLARLPAKQRRRPRAVDGDELLRAAIDLRGELDRLIVDLAGARGARGPVAAIVRDWAKLEPDRDRWLARELARLAWDLSDPETTGRSLRVRVQVARAIRNVASDAEEGLLPAVTRLLDAEKKRSGPKLRPSLAVKLYNLLAADTSAAVQPDTNPRREVRKLIENIAIERGDTVRR